MAERAPIRTAYYQALRDFTFFNADAAGNSYEWKKGVCHPIRDDGYGNISFNHHVRVGDLTLVSGEIHACPNCGFNLDA